MRAIIIEEDRFVEVHNLMKARAAEIGKDKQRSLLLVSPEVRQLIEALPQGTWECMISDIHRSIHFEFVRWAQSHGASCVRS